MEPEPKVQIGRLAMREEGDNWNAYYAMPGTIEGAIFLGSIKMNLTANPARREAFIALMRECVGDVMEKTLGQRPTWGSEMTGPEKERTRKA